MRAGIKTGRNSTGPHKSGRGSEYPESSREIARWEEIEGRCDYDKEERNCNKQKLAFSWTLPVGVSVSSHTDSTYALPIIVFVMGRPLHGSYIPVAKRIIAISHAKVITSNCLKIAHGRSQPRTTDPSSLLNPPANPLAAPLWLGTFRVFRATLFATVSFPCDVRYTRAIVLAGSFTGPFSSATRMAKRNGFPFGKWTRPYDCRDTLSRKTVATFVLQLLAPQPFFDFYNRDNRTYLVEVPRPAFIMVRDPRDN